jgi:hypothetical protein
MSNRIFDFQPLVLASVVMRIVSAVGLVILLLGVLSFFIAVPHRHDHSLKIGDSRIGVQTQRNQMLPTVASVTLVAAGILVLVIGSRKS